MEPTALVIDTETTGLKDPQVIELATKGPLAFSGLAEANVDIDPNLEIQVSRFRPTKDIEPGAMATHGIIPLDLMGKPVWPGSWTAPAGVGFLIGHNVDHDFDALGKPAGVQLICTLVLARRLWPDEPSHRLSTMMYVLFAPSAARDLTRSAHESAQDVHNCSLLLDACIWELKERGMKVESWADLATITSEFRVPLRIGFSKYGPKNGEPGMLYTDVPTGFLEWMVNPVRVNDMDQWEVAAARQQLKLRGRA